MQATKGRRTPPKRVTRTMQIAPTSLLLSVVGKHGVAPSDPPSGYDLEKITTVGSKLTFHYVRKSRGG